MTSNAAPPQLQRLVYVSTLSASVTDADVDAIVSHSRTSNEARNITGVLAVDGTRVCQILEGPSLAVERLFERIRADSRHMDITELLSVAIGQRHFGKWGMSRRKMVDIVSLSFAI